MPFVKSMFFDSAQATIKDLTRGYVKFILQEPFGGIPDAQIACTQFSFTNFFVNISAAIGNNHFYYSDDPLLETKYDITIPDGSYSITDLNTYITNQLKAAHAGVELFSLVPNYSTNKIGILFGSVAGWYVHFDAASPFTLLGFNNPQNVPVGKSASAYYLEYGPNSAAFNNVSNVKLSTNLTNDSISNTNQSNVIMTVAPVVDVGSTQMSQVFNLLWMGSDCLKDKVTAIEFTVSDQNDQPLLLSEDFSLILQVRGN